jgi:hypothetical protein
LFAEKENNFVQTSQPTDVTVDGDSASEKNQSATGWKLSQLFETVLPEGQKIVDFDSCGDRLFVITTVASLFEISLS